MLERKKVRELMLLLGTTMLTVENPKWLEWFKLYTLVNNFRNFFMKKWKVTNWFDPFFNFS